MPLSAAKSWLLNQIVLVGVQPSSAAHPASLHVCS